MSPARNDPCPCGSGRKYKNCCGKSLGESTGSAPSPELPPEVLERARKADRWEADLVAVPAAISGKERFRTVASLVVAGDMAVQTDVRLVTSAEPTEVAGELETALAEAATTVGIWPATVVVRREEVADALRPLLRPRGCAVLVAPVLSNLDPLAADLHFHFSGSDTWPAVRPPETWAAWGLPAYTVASLFRAYAVFYRAAPWRWLDDHPPVLAEWDDGTGPWSVSVLGSAMGEYGLAVYSEGEDLEDFLDAQGPLGDDAYDDEDYDVEDDEDWEFEDDEDWDEDFFEGGEQEDLFDDAGEDSGSGRRWRRNPFRNLRGWVVHLGYLHREQLSRTMVKEISRAQWKVQAVDAYPYISPVLTPGGGLQRDLVDRLIQILQGVAALADEHGSRLGASQGGVFSWEGGGLTLRCVIPPLEEPRSGSLPPGFEDVMEKIRSGELGSMDEIREAVNRRMDDLNATPQEELAGISPDQAAALLQDGFEEESPLRLSESLTAEELEGSAFLFNARTFLTALLEADGSPATTAGNLKRAFVAEMLEKMRFEDRYLDQLLRVNKVINEEDVRVLHVLRINLEVGGLLKRRKGHFSLTRKGKELAKPEQGGRLMAHLFRTYFGTFNIAYGSRGGDDPSLQPVVPLLLWQIGARAREWISLRDLALQILPSRPGPPPPDGGPQWWPEESDLHRWVLRPLEEFGLLEERDIAPQTPPRWRPQEIQLRTTPLYEAFLRFEWQGGRESARR